MDFTTAIGSLLALFPLRSADARAEVHCRTISVDGLADLELVLWGRDPWGQQPRHVRDLKAQYVQVLRPEDAAYPYLTELLLGWALAVIAVLDGCQTVENLLPGDLVPDRRIFGLKCAHTAEDFRTHFLAKHRLGRYL